MKEVERKTLQAILRICRQNGVTIEGLIKSALGDDTNISNEQTTKNINRRITNIIKRLGITAKIKGYEYIRYAIAYAYTNPDILNHITGGLYPKIAEKFSTTVSGVERTIRHAIDVVWVETEQETKQEIIEEIFGYTSKSKKNSPTNAEFIKTLFDYIINIE